MAILILLYIQFRTWKDALIILGTLPFGAVGGVLALFVTHTNFSISAAVGFTSLTGVATLGASRVLVWNSKGAKRGRL